jgi:hypothetical protein
MESRLPERSALYSVFKQIKLAPAAALALWQQGAFGALL